MINEKDIRDETLLDIAKKMMTAARTAPKGKGVDTLEIAAITGSEITKMSDYLNKMVSEGRAPDFFARDAGNILQSPVVVLIGTKIQPLGVAPCGYCGFSNCAEKAGSPDTPCVFNVTDLGIAIGAAVSIAADNRVDNRVMYTIGVAAKEMGMFDADVKIIYGIPVSATSKSPFFDRK
ncbi:MAG: DUF2148 domain-containing protein [Spirochaetales bacterium]|uniref:DUF2148 domain-containing protein n=1 Tax=Candidatus Thalassospirochaeta sargassi TaxID=3119039 RepID=A0AAJ1IKU1_9SPIO|nr:DUF2148 domain-containing protein [Spirochaetales bacterium]